MIKKLILDAILVRLAPSFFCGSSYLYLIFDVAASYYCMQLQGKLINQIFENGKKPSFGTNFGPFDSNLAAKSFHQKSDFISHQKPWSAIIMYNITKKTNDPVFVCLFINLLIHQLTSCSKKLLLKDQKAVWKESFSYQEQLTSDTKVAIKFVKQVLLKRKQNT